MADDSAASQRWNRRSRQLEQRDRPVDVQLGASPRCEQLLGQLRRALLVGDVVARHREPRLCASHIGVRQHDFGGDGDQRQTAKRPLTREVCARGGNGGATSAEHVDLPARIDASIEQVDVGRGEAGDLRLATLESYVRAAEWPIRALLLPQPRSRQPHERGGFTHVGASAQRPLDKRRDGVVSKRRPPRVDGSVEASAGVRRGLEGEWRSRCRPA